jgi:hypothetical protein
MLLQVLYKANSSWLIIISECVYLSLFDYVAHLSGSYFFVEFYEQLTLCLLPEVKVIM